MASCGGLFQLRAWEDATRVARVHVTIHNLIKMGARHWFNILVGDTCNPNMN